MSQLDDKSEEHAVPNTFNFFPTHGKGDAPPGFRNAGWKRTKSKKRLCQLAS